MALCTALLGLDQGVHVLGPLANCHWSELILEPHDGVKPVWRMRAHNLGVPGAVLPTPVRVPAVEEATDADA